MKKFTVVLYMAMLVLVTGCAEKQTHFGITAPTQTWINVFLVVSAVTLGLVVWGLVLLGRWLMVGLRNKRR